jgi:integrase
LAAFSRRLAPKSAAYLLADLGRRANVEHLHPHHFRHDAARRLAASVDLPTVATGASHPLLGAR